MNKNLVLKIFAALSFAVMITVNIMANTLPINNRNTAEISDGYANLFAPAGITFAIWGIIYLLLLGFVIYQFFPFSKTKEPKNEKLLQKINIYFIISSIANSIWIFTWHYDFIALSVVLMLTLLLCLIKIAEIIRKEKLTNIEKAFISIPFSVYFGWITVATIANITVFLVSINWSGFGVPDFIWTCLILIVGAAIGILRLFRDKNIAYILVIIWAYFGILLKHVSTSGFNGMYPSIMITTIICLIAFIIAGILVSKNLKLNKLIN